MSQILGIPRGFCRPTTRLALVAVLSALSLGSDYAMWGLPNVKLMDTISFLATYLFGLSVGLPVVIVTRTVYASVNPWGPASGLLIAELVAGDSLFALAGFLARKFRPLESTNRVWERSISLGLIGFFCALGFDLVTNFASGLIAVSGPNFQTYLGRAFLWGLATMNFPLPMGILHEVSDFLFFSTVAPAATSLLNRSQTVYLSADKTGLS